MLVSVPRINPIRRVIVDVIPDLLTINEGQSVVFTIKTNYLRDQTPLNWVVVGTYTSADFVGPAAGVVAVVGAEALVTLQLSEDGIADGQKKFALRVFANDQYQDSELVTVLDTRTSVPPGSAYFSSAGTHRFVVPHVMSISCACVGKGGSGGSDFHGNGGGGGGGGALTYATFDVVPDDAVVIVIDTQRTAILVNGVARLEALAGSNGTGGNTDRAGTRGSAGSGTLKPGSVLHFGTNGMNGRYSSTGTVQAAGGTSPMLPNSSLGPGQLLPGGINHGVGGLGATKSKGLGSGVVGGARIIWGAERSFPSTNIADPI